MCVPWPGEYLLVGPRSWPGVTRVGNAIVVGGGGQAWRGGSARVLSRCFGPVLPFLSIPDIYQVVFVNSTAPSIVLQVIVKYIGKVTKTHLSLPRPVLKRSTLGASRSICYRSFP